ncbi:MAG: L-threonylcarbamoyladenylate synthase [Thermoplasmata archaeon]
MIYKCDYADKIADYVRDDFAVLPADTLYALSISIFSENSKRIYSLKGRSSSIPVPVGVYDLESLEKIAFINDFLNKILSRDWSYLVTVVLKNRSVPEHIAGETVGIRIPRNEIIKKIIKRVGPVTLTSANLHGGKNPINVIDSYEQLGDKIKYYLDCGPCSGIPSTVVDLTKEEPKLIREGAIPFSWVMELYGNK